jgi:hypothetical protein
MQLRARFAASAAARMLRAAGAVFIAASLLAVAAPAAHADDTSPTFTTLFKGDVVLGVTPAPGKAVPIFLYLRGVVNPRLTIDVSGLAGVATVDTPADCTAGTTIICALPSMVDHTWDPFPITLHPVPGAPVGASGMLEVTASGDNVADDQSTAQVTLADGVDLVMTADYPVLNVQTEKRLTVPVTVANAGTKSAVGIELLFIFDPGVMPNGYTNCEYADVDRLHLVLCDFPDIVAPGKAFALLDGFGATPLASAAKSQRIDIFAQAADEASVAPSSVKLSAKPHSTKTLRLAAAAADVPEDIDALDNFAEQDVVVTNSHGDVAAVGATASGALNSVVQVTLGVKNLGPAALDMVRNQEPAVFFVFVVPPGTAAVAVPKSCFGVDSNGSEHPGGTGAARYLCHSAEFVAAGESVLVTFSLKITSVIPNAAGKATLDGDLLPSPVYHDDNLADNTAAVVINPSTGGSGGGGGLPVTGIRTGLIVAGGGLLLLAGAALIALTRRRTV